MLSERPVPWEVLSSVSSVVDKDLAGLIGEQDAGVLAKACHASIMLPVWDPRVLANRLHPGAGC